MTDELRILIVDDDEVLRGVVASFLTARGFLVETAADGQEALRLVHEGEVPNLVITDVRMPGLDGLELTRRLRTHHRTSRIPIIMLSDRKRPEEILAGYTQGADEYVPKPVEMPVLAAKVETILRRFQVSTPDDTALRTGRVILMLHGKGGVGATTVAVNVAAALVLGGSYPVALLDLNLEFGNVPLMLNLVPKHTLADMSTSDIGQMDDAAFHQLVLEHSSNIWVVPGSTMPEQAGLVSPYLVTQAINLLRDRAQYVIVDAPASFSEANLAVLDTADAVCLIAAPQIAALKAAADCVEVLRKLDFPENRTLFVLNRTTPTGLSDKQTEVFLRHPPDITIPYADRFDEAANSGRPLVTAYPTNASATKLRDIAGRLTAMLATTKPREVIVRTTEGTPMIGEADVRWQG